MADWIAGTQDANGYWRKCPLCSAEFHHSTDTEAIRLVLHHFIDTDHVPVREVAAAERALKAGNVFEGMRLLQEVVRRMGRL